MRVVCIYYENGVKDHSSLKGFAEACLQFTPQIALRRGRPSAAFLEIQNCAGIYEKGLSSTQAERKFIRKILSLAQSFFSSGQGAQAPSISISNDPASAFAMARFQVSDPKELPIEALKNYVSPFFEDALLEKQAERAIDVFKKLGVFTIQRFSKLPPGTLASRFGQVGVELSRSIRESFILPWPMFEMEEKIREGSDFKGDSAEAQSCAFLEPLLFTHKALLDRIMERLRGRGMRASVLKVGLTFDGGSEVYRELDVALPVPQSTTSGALGILKERMALELERNPMQAAVSQTWIQVEETAPGQGAQRDFFSKKEEEEETWEGLYAQLIERLGQGRAFFAKPVDRHVPELSWEKEICSQLPSRRSREASRAELRSSTRVPAEVCLVEGAQLSSKAAPRTHNSQEVSSAEKIRPARLLPDPVPLKTSHTESPSNVYAIRGRQKARELSTGESSYSAPLGSKTKTRTQSQIIGRWKVLKWIGPERIQAEWWNSDGGVERDYYQVVTATGERLWVYFHNRTQQFYLHGYFD